MPPTAHSLCAHIGISTKFHPLTAQGSGLRKKIQVVLFFTGTAAL